MSTTSYTTYGCAQSINKQEVNFMGPLSLNEGPVNATWTQASNTTIYTTDLERPNEWSFNIGALGLPGAPAECTSLLDSFSQNVIGFNFTLPDYGTLSTPWLKLTLLGSPKNDENSGYGGYVLLTSSEPLQAFYRMPQENFNYAINWMSSWEQNDSSVDSEKSLANFRQFLKE